MRYEGPTAFVKIEKEMPSGLHDGQLYSLTIDRENRAMSLEVAVDVSHVPERPTGHGTSMEYRRCRLHLTGVVFVRVDGPCTSADGEWDRDGGIDDGPLDGKRLAEVLPSGLPKGTFARWIYLHGTGPSEFRGFIYFVATGAELEWLE